MTDDVFTAISITILSVASVLSFFIEKIADNKIVIVKKVRERKEEKVKKKDEEPRIYEEAQKIYNFDAKEADKIVREKVQFWVSRCLSDVAKASNSGLRKVVISIVSEEDELKERHEWEFYKEVCHELKCLGFKVKCHGWMLFPLIKISWKAKDIAKIKEIGVEVW